MPDFIDRIASAAGFMRKEKGAIPSVYSSSGGDPFSIWKSSKKVDASKAFEVYTGWVYACIRAIAEEIGTMRFELYKITDAEGTQERIYRHEIFDTLLAPNAQQTGMEMLYTIAAHLEAIGNAYIFLDGVKDAKGKPTALYVLDASKVKVLADRNAFPATVTGYEYRTSTKEYRFEPYQILHIKYPDPADPFEGIGTVQTAAQWIDADNYAMEFNRRFFLNGARIGGFLEAQQAYTTEQLEYIKKSFEAAYKGVENAHKVLALPVGTKYTEPQNTQKDMDFANMMTMMRDRILAAFRVPRTALGITDDVNRANAEATDYVFAARTIKPKMAIIVSYLNEFFIPRYGDEFVLSFEDPVPENRELRIREMQAATGNAPVISANEAREEYFGLDPIENGEEVMVPFNFSPLGAPSQKKSMRKPRTAATPAPRVKSQTARNTEKRSSIAKTIAEAAAKSAKTIAKAIEKAKKDGTITELSDEQFEPIYKAFNTRVSSYEKKLRDDLRKENARQEKEVIANIEDAVKSKGVDPKKLLDAAAATSAVIDLATPLLEDLYSKEGKEAAGLLGFSDIDPLNSNTKKALEKAIKLMAGSYTDETLTLLKAKLDQGISDGLGLDGIKRLVKEVYEFSDNVRAERVARTETFRVANEGTKEAWKQTGVVKTIKWYTAADERVCEWCDPQHGKTIDIDDDFYSKGDKVRTDDGRTLDLDYSDIGAPPLHVSCRCYVRPETISLD